jgi:uncharacterized protein YciI
VILARAGDREEVLAVVASDPFSRAGVTEYAVVELRPTAGPLADVLAGRTQPLGT